MEAVSLQGPLGPPCLATCDGELEILNSATYLFGTTFSYGRLLKFLARELGTDAHSAEQ